MAVREALKPGPGTINFLFDMKKTYIFNLFIVASSNDAPSQKQSRGVVIRQGLR